MHIMRIDGKALFMLLFLPNARTQFSTYESFNPTHSSQLINACFTRSATYTENAGLDGLQALYLIPDPSFAHPTEPMDLPVSSFTSPFIGKSLDELIDIFDTQVSADENSEHDLMAASVFMILDEQSKQDDCLRVVQMGEEGLRMAMTRVHDRCAVAFREPAG